MPNAESTGSQGSWLLVSSHGLVLCYLALHADATIKAVSAATGLTERRILTVIKDLDEAGLVSVKRVGRRNHYQVQEDARFRHETMAHVRVADFVALVGYEENDTTPADYRSRG
jgi:hypothetical protein